MAHQPQAPLLENSMTAERLLSLQHNAGGGTLVF